MNWRIGVLLTLLLAAIGVMIVAATSIEQPRTPLRADANGDLDISYAEHDDRNRLDVYTPDGEGPFPTLIWIHPGGWRSGDKADPMPIWDWTERGYAIVAINYRYAVDPHTVADSIADARSAVDFIFENHTDWNLDPTRIGVFGFSAGGHLAAMVAIDEPRLAAVAMAGAPTDFSRLLDRRDSFFDLQDGEAVVRIAETRLGCKLEVPPGCDELAKAASPVQLDGGVAPRLVVHGELDGIVAVDHATTYVDSLEPQINAELVLIPEGGHTPNVEAGGVAEFFDRYLLDG